MAKTRDHGKSGKLPKRIGGVKLPKEVLKGAQRLIAAAASPAGRELIAAAMTVTAAAIKTQAGRSHALDAGKSDAAKVDRAQGAVHAPSGHSETSPPHVAHEAGDPHQIGVHILQIVEAAFGGLFRAGK